MSENDKKEKERNNMFHIQLKPPAQQQHWQQWNCNCLHHTKQKSPGVFTKCYFPTNSNCTKSTIIPASKLRRGQSVYCATELFQDIKEDLSHPQMLNTSLYSNFQHTKTILLHMLKILSSSFASHFIFILIKQCYKVCNESTTAAVDSGIIFPQPSQTRINEFISPLIVSLKKV